MCRIPSIQNLPSRRHCSRDGTADIIKFNEISFSIFGVNDGTPDSVSGYAFRLIVLICNIRFAGRNRQFSIGH